MNSLIHESAYVDKGAVIGEGTKIWHFSHIMNTARIGSNCIIGQNVFVGGDVEIGDNCKIQNNVSIYKGVSLKNYVFIGSSVVFTNVINPRAFIERKYEFRPTLIELGVTIGANATIICGVTLGEFSMVAAGAVVTKNVDKYTLVRGVPAEFYKFVDKNL